LGKINKMLSKTQKNMKFNRVVNVWAMAAILCASAVGCKNPQRVTPIPKQGAQSIADTGSRPIEPGPTPPLGPGTAVQPANTDGTIPTSTVVGPDWTPSAEQPFRSETVYFDYDKSTVRSSEVSKIETVASGMKTRPGKALRIEGHCDERGTEEYNRSLGERRALAVREHLGRLGVDANMITTISYGEDKPTEAGHTEAAWSKNRRAEFILLDPPGGSASK
jgi:peptidoglycan-associated lipoprotein